MKGLGDAIEYVTTATGIKVVMTAAAQAAYDAGLTDTPDCKCDKRKEALNEMVPFKK